MFTVIIGFGFGGTWEGVFLWCYLSLSLSLRSLYYCFFFSLACESNFEQLDSNPVAPQNILLC